MLSLSAVFGLDLSISLKRLLVRFVECGYLLKF
jgi:hypothetical protein